MKQTAVIVNVARGPILNEKALYTALKEKKIRGAVIDAINNANLSKRMVDEWNSYLDFDLHEKLQTYGFVGSARLNKIFAV